MKKILIVALLLAKLADPQSLHSRLAPTGGDTPGAQVSQTLKAWKKFADAHPGAVESRRLENAIDFDNGDGTHTAVMGKGLAYVDPQSHQLQLSSPVLHQTANGWARLGTKDDFFIRKRGATTNYDVVHSFSDADGDYWFGMLAPGLTYTSGMRFSMTGGWNLDLDDDGLEMSTAPITTARGARTYTVGYSKSGNWALSVATDGSLTGNKGNWGMGLATMIGAGGLLKPCSAYTLTATQLSFTCDDAGVSLPYVIDPTLTTGDTSSSSPTVSGTPYSNLSFTTSSFFSGLTVVRTLSGQYQVSTGLALYDTSSVSGTITSASLDVNLSSGQSDNGCNLGSDYTTLNGNAAFVRDATTVTMNAFTVVMSDLISAGDLATSLANTNLIVKGGFTKLRFHMRCPSDVPTGNNHAVISTTLTVNYVSSKPKLLIIRMQ